MREDVNAEYYKSLKGAAGIAARIEQGKLPMIAIAGHLYFSNVAFGILEPLELQNGNICIGDLEMHKESKKLHFLLHLPSMARIEIPAGVREFPECVVQVELPNMHHLDPVGMAKRESREPGYYLRNRYLPLKMYREAKIIPLKKTQIAALIRRNRADETGQANEEDRKINDCRCRARRTSNGRGL